MTINVHPFKNPRLCTIKTLNPKISLIYKNNCIIFSKGNNNNIVFLKFFFRLENLHNYRIQKFAILFFPQLAQLFVVCLLLTFKSYNIRQNVTWIKDQNQFFYFLLYGLQQIRGQIFFIQYSITSIKSKIIIIRYQYPVMLLQSRKYLLIVSIFPVHRVFFMFLYLPTYLPNKFIIEISPLFQSSQVTSGLIVYLIYHITYFILIHVLFIYMNLQTLNIPFILCVLTPLFPYYQHIWTLMLLSRK
eukprot:TRINITY_DN4889_c0_g2_i6.p1 TRINITY_DN4889_c0_g2~~TRINITY_DN4889_c0_g2_i6.p1  ORF type:complete len:245 (-),score=-31.74 TRINITY_DN4889_c0_g2_i6:22-756(-)